MKHNATEFIFAPPLVKTLVSVFKNLIYRSITKKSLNLFIRGGDLISVNPLTNGIHEPGITEVVSHFCENGFSDFLIDVGANIGLTTCQNGNSFSKIICFEPNPLCVHILKVNTEIAITKSVVEINEYGLGSEMGTYELWVPKHNWGGAFVVTDQNAYSDDILASKDGFSNVDKNNYSVKPIDIRSSESILTEKFADLINLGLTSGIVKIDVEGMEMPVIAGLARALPAVCNIVIVFENWDANFEFKLVENAFIGRSIEMYIFRSAATDDGGAKIWRPLRHARQKFGKHALFPIKSVSNTVGDVILIVK